MFVKFFSVSRSAVGVCALTVLSVLISSENAHARCSIRVADVLIKARYQGCNPKAMLSYLYSDLVTPFSFTCAKRLRETCHQENCADPKTPEEEQRCLSRYAEVLNACPNEIEGAAKMARCKDTKVWAVNLPSKSSGSTALLIPATAPAPTTPGATAGHPPVETNTASAPVTAEAPITQSVSNAPIITPATTGPAPIQVAPATVSAPVLTPVAPVAPAVQLAAPAAAAPAAVTTTAPVALPPSGPTTVYRPIMTAPVAPTPAPNPVVNPGTQTQYIPIHRQNRIRITNPSRTLIYRASQSSPAHP